MIHYFNRAVLLRDTDAESVQRMQSALKKAGVPCKVKRERSSSAKPMVRIPRSGRTGSMGMDPYSNSYVNGGVPHSWAQNSPSKALCTVYVQKKDLSRAKKICEIG